MPASPLLVPCVAPSQFFNVVLCPLQATRIPLVSQPGFATGLVSQFTRLLPEESAIRGLYSDFGPILFKQVPERILRTVKTLKDLLPSSTIIMINKQKGVERQSTISCLIDMAKQLGVGGLFIGLGLRIIMIATRTAGQFAIYGDI
ncbi:hypothetical protein BJV82DRAFT_668837 [Fennellomyces sp. T-0311]|nr:hypothetical protein BJV82DRAFT_668837 [Fennellomyces sp. T-0311]